MRRQHRPVTACAVPGQEQLPCPFHALWRSDRRSAPITCLAHLHLPARHRGPFVRGWTDGADRRRSGPAGQCNTRRPPWPEELETGRTRWNRSSGSCTWTSLLAAYGQVWPPNPRPTPSDQVLVRAKRRAGERGERVSGSLERALSVLPARLSRSSVRRGPTSVSIHGGAADRAGRRQ